MLPIVHTSHHPDEHYQRSPFLFWCILTVAARRYSGDPLLLPSLHSRILDMAASLMFSPSADIHVIEGLLLLLTWLFPMSPTYSENSFVLCGTMLHLAMKLGLHISPSDGDFSYTSSRLSKEDSKQRFDLWLHCVLLYNESGSPTWERYHIWLTAVKILLRHWTVSDPTSRFPTDEGDKSPPSRTEQLSPPIPSSNSDDPRFLQLYSPRWYV